MKRLTTGVLAGAIFAGVLSGGFPARAQGDDYWTTHWGWYDKVYHPYYNAPYYRRWEPGPYNSRVPPYPSERSAYVPGPSGGRVYHEPSRPSVSPVRYGWW